MNHSYISDFFALGVIAYEMTAGKVIFSIMFRDLIMVILAIKSENKFCQNKCRSNLQKFLKTGLLIVLISSINFYKENLNKG